jgi:pimeloyl-ACP methyl ester carboxylesterase
VAFSNGVFAEQGWHCVAPDMRGYGSSSIPRESKNFALRELVLDMVELHDHLGGAPAIWVGHDWGSPVVASLSAHHAFRVLGVVLISVPYFPEGFVLSNLLSLIDRKLYPLEQYPYGQWDYFNFYSTNFEQTVSDFEADTRATLACIYRQGDSAAANRISHTALVAANGGFFGTSHRAPAITPDPELWPSADFDVLVKAFETNGFRSANSWYLNDDSNRDFAKSAPANGELKQPVLFIVCVRRLAGE